MCKPSRKLVLPGGDPEMHQEYERLSHVRQAIKLWTQLATATSLRRAGGDRSPGQVLDHLEQGSDTFPCPLLMEFQAD
jgi:hypothetical protein